MNNYWSSVEMTLPATGMAVLVARRIGHGQYEKLVARHQKERTLPLNMDCPPWYGCEYDEATDEFYVAPGWYEFPHVGEDDRCIRLDNVTHFQYLPKDPRP